MKFNFSTPFYLLLTIPLFFTSCAKTGPEGPAGATGAQGAAGPTGTAGAQGTKGDPGAANVIYSQWLDVTYSGSDSTAWIATIAAPQLVDSILNKGTMKVYLNAGSDSVNSQFVMALPIYDAFVVGAIINPYFSNQSITLASTADLSTVTDNGNKYFQYRYVLIPGGTAAGRNPKGIDWNDYQQVKKYLGLKD